MGGNSIVNRLLLLGGAFLFLIGLIQGVAVQSFANPRMALSAHLAAVQSGMAIMIAGLAWEYVSMRQRVSKSVVWSILVGMYGLWLGISLAAVTGASEALPFAGKGFEADSWAEETVTLIVMTSGVACLFGWLGLCVGLYTGHRRKHQTIIRSQE